MSLYGLPPKVINIVKDMYANNLCCVRHEGQHSEWFQVKTGVRQGCIISPLLFLIVIDYVMRTATADKPRGLVWGLFHRLEDSDFAHKHSDIQEKTDRVASTAKKVGLKIHAAKTKVMKAKNKFRVPVTVEGEPLEEVKDFKYLRELHFIRQQHRQRGVYQNWSRSSGVQETEQHLEVHNSQYQNHAQNLPVQRTFNSSLRLRDVESQQEVGEQTSGLRREMFTENIES